MSDGYVALTVGDISVAGTYIDALHLATTLIATSAMSADAMGVNERIWARALVTALKSP